MKIATHLAALTACVILAACAATGTADHTAHQSPAGGTSTGQSQHQMPMMQGMHQKMMSGKTAEERAAMKAEHMKAMHGGDSASAPSSK